MKSNLKTIAKEIAMQLELKYSYYGDVWYGFIVEAVENTLIDFGYEIKPLDEIHNHIKSNYI